MNKSLGTNLVALVFVIAGFYSPVYQAELKSVGYFALSGAITNWLAIHMLFEKVPGLYGSGIIPSQFEEFKRGIKSLMMDQFFTNENIDKFFHNQKGNSDHDGSLAGSMDFTAVISAINYDTIFAGLLDVIGSSSFGGMLAMFGGISALEPLRDPIKEKMQLTVTEIVKSDDFLNALEDNILPTNLSESVIAKVEEIVDGRLDELTPTMVKDIIQDMIKKHLGWLVVWGGVFGGAIGLAMTFFN